MKFIKNFETNAQYEAYIATDYPKPNVSYCVQENEVYYNILPPPFFCKLTLNNGDVVEIPGSGELNDSIIYEIVPDYTETCVSAEIGEACTSIGDFVFQYCRNLTSVTIPDSVTSIDEEVFEGCGSLTSITIPSGVTSIVGFMVFYGCSSLTSITVDNGNTVYDSRNNCNAIIETSTNTLIQGCNTTVIPNSVTSIGTYAFNSCSGLTNVTIPNSVTSIDEEAFSGCTSLTSVTIGNGVTSIDYGAFVYCSSLTSVTVNATTPPTLSYDVFKGTNTNLTIYVPAASVEAYKVATNWSTYASRIQAIQ